MIEIEHAFGEITALLLGQKLSNIDDYGDWLGKHVPLPTLAKSIVSGKDVWIPPTMNYFDKPFNKSKIISMEEMDRVNVSPFIAKDIETATIGELMTKFIKPLSFFCGNFRYQEYENMEKVSGGGGGRNVYVGEDTYLGVKNIGFSNYTLYCENMFGCYALTNSQFCIHAYRSILLSRCFEVDSSSNCRDLLFCHNCENVSDSMFCFNAKNLKNAIANVLLPQVKYREIKEKILADIGKELTKTKNLKYDIFNIGDSNGS
ncbi:MAG: hypothetical protein ABID61_04175 [Candidatus Micrarchaeota archaeon]